MSGAEKQTVYIVAGPTASGKSSKAIELAKKSNGIIINCDSMQLYNGLPILSAQPPDTDKQIVPHRLYAEIHPNDICSAGDWSRLVTPIIHKTFENNQTPIITGGSGLYIKALTQGLSPVPDIPNSVRQEAIQKQKNLGNPAFHAELEKLDPIIAARLEPNNTARLVRAYEVVIGTGKPLSEWQKEPRIPPPAYWDFNFEIILPERETLYERCNERFELMIEMGALDEVAALTTDINEGRINDNVPLTKALGYKELRDYLAGDLSREDAITKAQTSTRHYAKRQITWFTNQM